MSSGHGLKILIVDDHAVFRDSLMHALRSVANADVLGCASSVEAIEKLRETAPDLVIADFDLRQETAFELLARMADLSYAVPRVAILTAGVTKAQAQQLAANPNVCGILIKDTSLSQLIDDIGAMIRGDTLFDERYAAALSSKLDVGLTSRELEILKGLVEGLSNKELATALFVSESTVKNVLQTLFRKYKVRTRSQLVRVALEERHVR
jgi:two-component system, NarL family, nitrate/nitrite response regulator NarL